jgi:hypothetical protein
MILSDIKRYLIQHRQTTLADLALYCDAEPAAVRGMLQHWIRKGKLVKRMANNACGVGCNLCDPAVVEIYHWVDDATLPESGMKHAKELAGRD